VTIALLLPIIRYAFLVGLLLFVGRVLQAVLADLDPRTAAVTHPRTTLVFEEPAAWAGRQFLVAGDAMIGRAPGCAIVVDDDYVSAQHAQVYERDGRVWVEDLQSTNGTMLNGRPVRRPTTLRSGDHLRIGHAILTIRVESR
jgi:FHA domain-containing protein